MDAGHVHVGYVHVGYTYSANLTVEVAVFAVFSARRATDGSPRREGGVAEGPHLARRATL